MFETLFENRQDAARKLAQKLQSRSFTAPVVLGIPRGGVVLADIIARSLNADLGVLLARKLRAPSQPELAIGAISENKELFLYDPQMLDAQYLEKEKEFQYQEIQRRRELIKKVCPAIPLEGRSVLVTDDGVATGSTLIAGLYAVRAQNPLEIIVAVPVASASALKRILKHCSDLCCLIKPSSFLAIGQFYKEFEQLSDAAMLTLLEHFYREKRGTLAKG